MEREEIEAMWERIKALEENQLKVSKLLCEDSATILYTLAGTVLRLRKGNLETYREYMGAKVQEVCKQIRKAEDVDSVISLVREFTDDCVKFVESLSR